MFWFRSEVNISLFSLTFESWCIFPCVIKTKIIYVDCNVVHLLKPVFGKRSTWDSSLAALRCYVAMSQLPWVHTYIFCDEGFFFHKYNVIQCWKWNELILLILLCLYLFSFDCCPTLVEAMSHYLFIQS